MTEGLLTLAAGADVQDHSAIWALSQYASRRRVPVAITSVKQIWFERRSMTGLLQRVTRDGYVDLATSSNADRKQPQEISLTAVRLAILARHTFIICPFHDIRLLASEDRVWLRSGEGILVCPWASGSTTSGACESNRTASPKLGSGKCTV